MTKEQFQILNAIREKYKRFCNALLTKQHKKGTILNRDWTEETFSEEKVNRKKGQFVSQGQQGFKNTAKGNKEYKPQFSNRGTKIYYKYSPDGKKLIPDDRPDDEVIPRNIIDVYNKGTLLSNCKDILRYCRLLDQPEIRDVDGYFTKTGITSEIIEDRFVRQSQGKMSFIMRFALGWLHKELHPHETPLLNASAKSRFQQGISMSAYGENKTCKGFTPQNLDKHWGLHREDVRGAVFKGREIMTPEDYNDMAVELLKQPCKGNIIGWMQRARNDETEIAVIRFDVKSGLFAVGTPNVGVITAYRMVRPIGQKGKYKIDYTSLFNKYCMAYNDNFLLLEERKSDK